MKNESSKTSGKTSLGFILSCSSTVLFEKALATSFAILTKSCAETSDTIKWKDGNEYPLFKMEISSDSHPFYTGKMKLVDTAGRIDKFKNKYAKFAK